MRNRSIIPALLVVTTLAANIDAGTISYWNFNDSTNTTTLFTASGGAAPGTMSSTVTAANIVSATGSTINAFGADSAGQALSLVSGAGNVNNGKDLTFGASTVGFDQIQVSFAARRTSTGFASNQLQYSTDGTTFINFSTPYVPVTDAFGLVTYDLSGVAGLNNNANTQFRIIFSGATNPAGTNQIDNLQITGQSTVSAVPEPASIVLFGLGSLGIAGVTYLRRRRQANPA